METTEAIDWLAATRECDVVMKGGTSSGVIYPSALHEFARSHRIRGIGGTSAGAIAAAFGAAAEHGRATGGFDRLEGVPAQLGEGRLARLFQPTDATAPLLRILFRVLALRRRGGVGILALIRAAVGETGGAVIPGVVPAIVGVVAALAGVGLAVAGAVSLGAAWIVAGVALVVAGVLLTVAGIALAVALAARSLLRTLADDVPANMFGICTGLSEGAEPALTDWIADRIDDLAGRDPAGRPLTFGDLWGGSGVRSADRAIDLRMISTCLSQSRPYELPWEGRRFFYRRAEWERLFPARVIAALDAVASPPAPEDAESTTPSDWEWENALARELGLVRFPAPPEVPVVVATRLSLSLPLLISAVPMYWIEHAGDCYRDARERREAGLPVRGTDLEGAFAPLWFSDGGLVSNFPVHLFDAPLPTRPTFAIDLQDFPDGTTRDADEARNSFLPRDNREGLTLPVRRLPRRGLGALAGFAWAALSTSRDWQDRSLLTLPGFRDRIVRVFQDDDEGGLNLDMSTDTIRALQERGRLAARKLVTQFDAPVFAHGGTGWDNHRWIRYRALLGTLPEFLRDYRRAEALVPDGDDPPSHPWRRAATRRLAEGLSEQLGDAADLLADDPAGRAELRSAPRPLSVLRRTART